MEVMLINRNADATKYPTAQVAIVDGREWMIVGPKWSIVGNDRFMSMPRVDCPVIDLSAAGDEKALRHAIAVYTTQNGIVDVPGLAGALVALGAVVRSS